MVIECGVKALHELPVFIRERILGEDGRARIASNGRIKMRNEASEGVAMRGQSQLEVMWDSLQSSRGCHRCPDDFEEMVHD